MAVTDFPHAKAPVHRRLLPLAANEAGGAAHRRLHALRLAEDRRYLLYNPVVKMKVTTQGEDVINHMWDVIAARVSRRRPTSRWRPATSGPSQAEGTVHVNIALIVKFMEN